MKEKILWILMIEGCPGGPLALGCFDKAPDKKAIQKILDDSEEFDGARYKGRLSKTRQTGNAEQAYTFDLNTSGGQWNCRATLHKAKYAETVAKTKQSPSKRCKRCAGCGEICNGCGTAAILCDCGCADEGDTCPCEKCAV